MIKHTIQIVAERRINGTVNAHRVSENRTYTACVVATVTETTIAKVTAEFEALKADVVTLEADIQALEAKLGLTVDQAVARYEVLRAERNTPEMDAARKAIRERFNDGTYMYITNNRAAIVAAQVAEGCADVWNEPVADLINKIGTLCSRRQTIAAGLQLPEVGAQSVIAWSGTPALAAKELKSHLRPGKRLFSLGYAFEVRTDIVIERTGKHAAK